MEEHDDDLIRFAAGGALPLQRPELFNGAVLAFLGKLQYNVAG